MSTRNVSDIRLRRLAGILMSAGILLVSGAGAANAHVTAHVDDPVRKAADVAVTFRVPNETDDAPTTRLDVHLPLDHPLLGVLLQPHPGWQGKATTSTLTQPVKTDDGELTQAVSEVVWTADSAADALQPGQSTDFVLTAGQLPETTSLMFPVVQTYADGQVVRWVDADADADNPAPTIAVAAAAPDRSHTDATARVLGGAGVAGALGSVGLLVTVRGRLRPGR